MSTEENSDIDARVNALLQAEFQNAHRRIGADASTFQARHQSPFISKTNDGLPASGIPQRRSVTDPNVSSLGNPGSGTSTLQRQPRNHIGPTNYGGTMPSFGYNAGFEAQKEAERLRERMERLSEPIVLTEEIPDYFRNLEIPKDDYRPTKTHFYDDEMLNKPAITLFRIPDNEVAQLGRVIMPMLSGGFNRWGGAGIFMLAYHLKKPNPRFGRDFVFEEIEKLGIPQDLPVNHFDKTNLLGLGFQTLMPSSDEKKEAAIYSFIAVSLLRVFTKSPKNYVKAWKHIIEGFARFYGKVLDIGIAAPTEKAIKSLSDWFSIEPRAKYTMYRLLYRGNEDEQGIGMKRFLYDMHICHTGLHIVNILLDLCKVWKASPGVIIFFLNNGRFESEIKCLLAMIRLMFSTDARNKRKMWKYGRIYDETFMADIRTKACPRLVYVLASALCQEEPKCIDKIKDIVQLGNVGKEARIDGDITARKLAKSIRCYYEAEGRYSVPSVPNF